MSSMTLRKRNNESSDHKSGTREARNAAQSAAKRAKTAKTAKGVESDNNCDDDYRRHFNAILRNINEFSNRKPLQVLSDEQLYVVPNRVCEESASPMDWLTDANDEQSDDQNDASVDTIAMKTRGEQDIQRRESSETPALANVRSVRELDAHQICCLINSFSQELLDLVRHSSDSSLDSHKSEHQFYGQMYEKWGFAGICSNLRTKEFDKWQQIYILGCLNSKFGNEFKGHLFATLFPEALVRIVMRVHRMPYNEAVDYLKPIAY